MSANATLPSGWAHATLGGIGEYHNGRGFKKHEWAETGRPIIRIQNLTDSAKPFNYYAGDDVDPRNEVRRGDLLVSWAATLDVFRWTGPDAVLNQHIFKVESHIEPDYHYYVLKATMDALLAQSHGSGMVHVTRDRFDAIPVALPPLEEERRIVNELQRLFSLIEAGERSFTDARDGCAHLRTSLLAQLAAPEFPRVSIGDIARVFVGATPSRKDPKLWGGDVAWVSSGEVAFCRITEARETITPAGLGNPTTRLHPAGTVLLAMIGEGKTRGQAAILDIPAAHNQNCASIRLDPERMLPEFLYYCLMSQYERNRQAGSGSQQPALNGGLVRAIEVPCPSLEEQARLVAELEERFAQVDVVTGNLSGQVKTSEQLRQSLLYHALSGKLCSQRLEEPADTLLSRIADRRGASSRGRSNRKKPRAVLVAE